MKKIMPFLMTTLAALSFAAASPSQSMAADGTSTVQRAAVSEAEAGAGMFGLGKSNDAYAQYFIGQSYLNPLTTEGLSISNVTFEPGCRNNWHIHHKGGQILLCTSGRGYYQEWGKPAQELHPGDVVNIPLEVKHWHGAAPDSWFAHIAIAVPAEGASNEWLEAVDDAQYRQLT